MCVYVCVCVCVCVCVYKMEYWTSLMTRSVKNLCNAGDLSFVPGSGRSPGEENGYPLQYSCMENPMDRRARQATVHEVAKSWKDCVTKPT